MVKLSIVMPVYNGEKFIKNSLDRVLSVECEKEIIVVNDCSKDNSLNLLKEYGSQIKLIDLVENKGVSNARNVGIKEATGDYISFLDIDDIIEPRNTRFRVIRALEQLAGKKQQNPWKKHDNLPL